MEILDQFGFDFRLFAAQIINFLIIAWIFKRFLYKPILNVLDRRNETIKKGLKDAEKAQQELEKAEVKHDEILKKASKEADILIQEAKAQSEIIRVDMLEKTKLDIEKMMEETKRQIDMERENFRNEARAMSLTLSEKILEQTIGTLFDKKQKDFLVKKGIDLIKHDKQAKN